MTEKQQELFESNSALVGVVLRRYYSMFLYMTDDLMQCGRIGLWKASVQYDETKGFKFSTYACTCIKTEMFKFIRTELKWRNATITNSTIGTDDGESYINNISEDIETDIINKIYVDEVIERCKMKDIVGKIAYGQTAKSVAEQHNITRQRIQQIMVKERSNVRKFIEDSREM